MEVHSIFFSVKDLEAYTVQAVDGEAGKLDDLLFDGERWTVRYFVVNTGSWLMGRKILLSPYTLENVDVGSRVLYTTTTKDKIENSPHITAHPPISRQEEADLSMYFGWPHYWIGPGIWGYYPYPQRLADEKEGNKVQDEVADTQGKAKTESHLRSANELMGDLTGYNIIATDGEIGHVDDFLVDEETWTIRYMIVDTQKWWPSKHVLVAPDWVTNVSWVNKEVTVTLSREEIKNGPVYSPDKPITREFEEELYTFYEKPRYWEEDW